MKIENLVWNVYNGDFNSCSTKVYNIFSNQGFLDRLKELKKDYKKAIKKEYQKPVAEINMTAWTPKYYEQVFKREFEGALMYFFWGKCGYEIGLTSWPPYIDKEEVSRIKSIDYEIKYRECISLETYEKVSVYDQVKLNFDFLAKYVWDNYINY